MRTGYGLVAAVALAAACGDHLTDINYGSSAAGLNNVVPGTGTPDGAGTGGGGTSGGLACTVTGLAPTQVVAQYDPNIIQRQSLQAVDAVSGVRLQIDNFTKLAGGIAAGSQLTLALDPNTASSGCGLCIRGSTPQDGNFTVQRGSVEVTTPAAMGGTLSLVFHDVVMTADGASSHTWCIPSLTLAAPATAWSCDQVHATIIQTCYTDAKAHAAAVTQCNNGVAVSVQNCAAAGLTCNAAMPGTSCSSGIIPGF
jgi:hypothetical protein